MYQKNWCVAINACFNFLIGDGSGDRNQLEVDSGLIVDGIPTDQQ
jgi:hypothetical protein